MLALNSCDRLKLKKAYLIFPEMEKEGRLFFRHPVNDIVVAFFVFSENRVD